MTSAKNTLTAKRAASRTRTDQAGATRQVLQVISKRDGFRRAGREWSGTTTVPLDDLTDEQIQQLKDEPMLVAFEVDVPDEPADQASTADTAVDQV